MTSLTGLRAILVSPTYGNVDPQCARNLRVAMMSAATQGLHWTGDASPDRMPYGFARNVAAATLRNHPDAADGIMWVDSDIVCPADSITRLLTAVKTHSLDFVTGVYHIRKPPYLPVLYKWDDTPKMYLQCLDYPQQQIISIDACGFGFVYTSSRLINAMADSPHFSSSEGWFPDRRDVGGFGEDISFCDIAKKCGFQLYVDTGVQVGHTGDPAVIWEANFRAQNLTIESPEIQNRPVKANWGKPPDTLAK